MDFISDITKEIIKDVGGQKIIYYPVSELKTLVHEVYDEAVKKMYDNPIVIEAFIDNIYDYGSPVNKFGVDKDYKIEAFVQFRDMAERGIEITLGDYFSYGTILYEITELNKMRSIYGQVEHSNGMRILGTRAREDALPIGKIFGPTDAFVYSDADAAQNEFHQQRGFETNADGPTGDSRALVKKGIIDEPLSGPKEISPRADEHGRNAFYGED